MRKLAFLMIGIFCIPMFLLSQEDDSKKSALVELDYIKPKIGMEKKLEQAIKAHNDKYHPDGPYSADLDYIGTGNEAGWYVWSMGVFSYTEYDDAPGRGDHSDDWDKRVAPYIEEYGRVELWKHSAEMSHSKEGTDPMMELWVLDLERGEWYRFKAMMEKVIVIHKKMDEEVHVWFNQYNQNDGRDVALTWPMKNWGMLDEDNWKMKEEFDKEYGEGSWDNFLDEWEDVVKGVSQEVWYNVK